MFLNQKPVWRLIPLFCASGKLQMAIDLWLLQQHKEKNTTPSLRFYTWNPPAISIGVSQKKHIPSHWQNLTYENQPLEIVKRPTGGRGVLHLGDLTYSVVTSYSQGTVIETYEEICQFLILGWEKLGLSLHLGKPKQKYLNSANCFSLATNADLMDDEGNKFIGSAQLRQGKYLLQHGSMMVKCDRTAPLTYRTLYEQVFNSSPPQINIPSGLIMPKIVNVLVEAAAECFQCHFEIQPLSVEEITEITETMVI
ncbi:biotin/lipoate A/B protein ligase family protein [Cyanobacterium sp. Dongsha4]|uniref:biotin/lipoate A/B protein ligase family protein n=1 Tax=Cyanobacterium sp. DS4 TaxID=2878255 RepID=UPI002E8154A5|nr:biotin/lipoate A/B protein ligase family protein [Cyanobacterium sp. Dongsha4]WVK99493.1 lipoate--protein ligase family protein [Cyanobacterium sp. Dongsha4]